MSIRDTRRKCAIINQDQQILVRTSATLYRQVLTDNEDSQLVLGLDQRAIRTEFVTQLERLNNYYYLTGQIPLSWKRIRYED